MSAPTPHERPRPFFRLRLIALGVGLGYLLRLVWGEYQANGDARRFVLPEDRVPAAAPRDSK